jgi:hypothetical protein
MRTTKADYVRSHHCHWPGCAKQVPPAMWGCKAHWFTLPAVLRARIWATYKPGQEVTMTPSAAYLEAADAVQAWIAERNKTPNVRANRRAAADGDWPRKDNLRRGLERPGVGCRSVSG